MEWDELQDRREKCRLGIFTAMHFNEVATEISNYIAPHQKTSLHSKRHTQQYLITHCRTKAHQNSFSISTAKLWNSIPPVPFWLVPLWQVRAGNVYPDQKLYTNQTDYELTDMPRYWNLRQKLATTQQVASK